MTPKIRIRELNKHPINMDGQYVLYWMTSFRRLHHNFSLQRASEIGTDLNKPIVILEALRCGYQWASDRHHVFAIQGMRDNASQAERFTIFYYPYLEPEPGKGAGLLEALAQRAAVVITDDFPSFFLPKMIQSAADKISVKIEAVDSNGLLPIRAAQKVYPTAYAFRRYLQKELPEHLSEFPDAQPLKNFNLPKLNLFPDEITVKWPIVPQEQLRDAVGLAEEMPINHDVKHSYIEGGPMAAEVLMRKFMDKQLSQYEENRNQPELDVSSGLSPFLHWGHISAHQIFVELTEKEKWSPARLGEKASGKRSGWWGMSSPAEAFLDQLITWREVGFNYCAKRDDYDHYESLPNWAKTTLHEHAIDKREYLYSLEEFEEARTHDELWNAAQIQLVREGRIHNYIRMLWGKKILDWSQSPQEALRIMIQLNNKYALDGRDPNSYSGILWSLGRYDRAWKEREIFGKVRYMSSKNTARKFKTKDYISKYNSKS